jgi:hypothetical protein
MDTYEFNREFCEYLITIKDTLEATSGRDSVKRKGLTEGMVDSISRVFIGDRNYDFVVGMPVPFPGRHAVASENGYSIEVRRAA